MFESFTSKWEQNIDDIEKLLTDMQQDIIHVNDRIVHLDLDIKQQLHQSIISEDEE